MTELAIPIWELTREEAEKRGRSAQILIYNPVLDTYKIVRGGKGIRKFSDYIKFFSLREDGR